MATENPKKVVLSSPEGAFGYLKPLKLFTDMKNEEKCEKYLWKTFTQYTTMRKLHYYFCECRKSFIGTIVYFKKVGWTSDCAQPLHVYINLHNAKLFDQFT